MRVTHLVMYGVVTRSALSTARPAERSIQAIRVRDAEASIFQYADDTQFHLNPDELPHAERVRHARPVAVHAASLLSRVRTWLQYMALLSP